MNEPHYGYGTDFQRPKYVLRKCPAAETVKSLDDLGRVICHALVALEAIEHVIHQDPSETPKAFDYRLALGHLPGWTKLAVLSLPAYQDQLRGRYTDQQWFGEIAVLSYSDYAIDICRTRCCALKGWEQFMEKHHAGELDLQIAFARKEWKFAPVNFASLLTCVEHETRPAPSAPDEPRPFQADPLTPIQQLIMQKLDGKALKVERLAVECKTDASTLYKHGLKTVLEERGMVRHTRNLGYWRLDAPPKSGA